MYRRLVRKFSPQLTEGTCGRVWKINNKRVPFWDFEGPPRGNHDSTVPLDKPMDSHISGVSTFSRPRITQPRVDQYGCPLSAGIQTTFGGAPTSSQVTRGTRSTHWARFLSGVLSSHGPLISAQKAGSQSQRRLKWVGLKLGEPGQPAGLRLFHLPFGAIFGSSFWSSQTGGFVLNSNLTPPLLRVATQKNRRTSMPKMGRELGHLEPKRGRKMHSWSSLPGADQIVCPFFLFKAPDRFVG